MNSSTSDADLSSQTQNTESLSIGDRLMTESTSTDDGIKENMESCSTDDGSKPNTDSITEDGVKVADSLKKSTDVEKTEKKSCKIVSNASELRTESCKPL